MRSFAPRDDRMNRGCALIFFIYRQLGRAVLIRDVQTVPIYYRCSSYRKKNNTQHVELLCSLKPSMRPESYVDHVVDCMMLTTCGDNSDRNNEQHNIRRNAIIVSFTWRYFTIYEPQMTADCVGLTLTGAKRVVLNFSHLSRWQAYSFSGRSRRNCMSSAAAMKWFTS